MRKIPMGLLTCFLGVLLVASMTPTTLADENILRIYDGTPSSFNPLLATRDIPQAVWYGGILYEPLVFRLLNGTLVPWLAKSWEILDDGKRYVFHMDERAKWSDGKPVTAEDVEIYWNLTIMYAFPSQLKGILEAVRAVDTYTVEFITTQPWARWYTDFGGSIALPAHIWSEIEDPLSYELIDDPSKHITSSAFKYDSFKPSEWWFFKKRPDYWKTEHMPKIDGILFRRIDDESTLPLLLMKGDIDIVASFPFYLLAQIVGKPNIGIWMFPQPLATEVLAVNTRLYPLNMKEVRQAIDLAIDKVDIAQNYFMGYGVPGNRCLINFAAAPEFYVSEAAWRGWGKTHEECVAEANSILDELGFTRGPDGIRVTPNGTRLSYKYILQMQPLTVVRLRSSEAIIDYLKEIGIEISQYQPLNIADYFATAFLAEEKNWGFAQGTYGEFPEPWYLQVNSYLLPYIGLPQVRATGFDETEPEVAAKISDLGHSAFQRINYDDLVADVKQIISIFKDYVPSICIAYYPMWTWVYRTDRFVSINPELAATWGAFGYPQPYRPLFINELTPVGWVPPSPTLSPTPTATATPKPTATPTPTATATPTPAATPTPTPTPTAAPTGLTTEQTITIAIIIIIIIAAIAYIATKTKRKPKT
ncbi:MAG: ABC transporter substrate-binding protein [Candidatus Bathyarchaeia archaeon]